MNVYNILDKKDYLNVFENYKSDVPLLDISDKDIMEVYNFRWSTYFDQIRHTEDGYVVTEFWQDVPWAGKYNTINCALGHHIYEGRWIHDPKYLDDYCRFWFNGGSVRLYSTWFADAVLARSKVTGDLELAKSLYEKLKENYFSWEKEKKRSCGMFYSIADRDGMEYMISGDGIRPTLNSYMYGDLIALAEIAELSGFYDDAKMFAKKADELRTKINTCLWDKDFYKNLSENNDYNFADVRELIGYIPWYFGIPEEKMSVAWKYLNDKNCFFGKYGPTTAERSHPDYMKEINHECLWNGPSWPYATAQTLTALGNLLNDYKQDVMTKGDYFELLKRYAVSQHLTNDDGSIVVFIDENLHPDTGTWIARDILRSAVPTRDDVKRGEKYNHSTFCDLVINGLVGIRPSLGNTLTVNPLFEQDQVEYMCLDGVLYHGKYIAVIWDKSGERYNRGKGLSIFVDGIEMAHSDNLCPIHVNLGGVQ